MHPEFITAEGRLYLDGENLKEKRRQESKKDRYALFLLGFAFIITMLFELPSGRRGFLFYAALIPAAAALLFFLYFIFDLLFKTHLPSKMNIQNIRSVILRKADHPFETEAVFRLNNGRRKIIFFRTLEKEHYRLMEHLKKLNHSVEIKLPEHQVYAMKEEFTSLSGKVYIDNSILGYESISLQHLWIKFAFAIPVIYFLILKADGIISHYNTDKFKFTIDLIMLFISSLLFVAAIILYLFKINWKRKFEINSITEVHLISDEESIETTMKIFTGDKRFKPFIFRTLEGEHLRLKEAIIKHNSTVKIVEAK